MKNTRMLNGYVVIYRPEHPKAMKGGNWDGYVYEHIVIAEKSQNTTILEGETVHHLDENRSNNSPENLLILRDSSHAKLHQWMDKNVIIPKPGYAIRKLQGCIRCLVCNEPVNSGVKYCSYECSGKARRLVERPETQSLLDDIKTLSMVSVGKKYGVSDNAVRKWCHDLGIDFKNGTIIES